MIPPLQHFILVRFNLPVAYAPVRGINLDPTWLKTRLTLLRQYLGPSLAQQTALGATTTLLMLDPRTPRYLLRPLREAGPFTLWFGTTTWLEELRTYLRTQLTAPRLITTRIDSDDAVDRTFVDRVQQAASRPIPPQKRLVVAFPQGCTHDPHGGILRTYEHAGNPFVSVVEPPSARLLTAYGGQHNLVRRRDDSVVVDIPSDRPMWLQAIHGGNVANKMQGVRVPDPVPILRRCGVRP